ncbi:MAG TPA: PIG-L family deacetylase [Bryobacteraceae bacterium]|nr:PIG-L family deacetylase [Bryobacteraceae bacterium]
MDRRNFLGNALGANALLAGMGTAGVQGSMGNAGPAPAMVVERPVTGRPHAGKVLAAIQPHADDIPLFASGTVAKLIDEGYTGYLIRVTNDDMTGPGSIGDGMRANEKDNQEVAKALGCRRVFDLNYSNHRLDEASMGELRARFIFLFRMLKADTVVCYDPWSTYEENPDHYVTARAVESACWIAAMSKDYPEHFAAGLDPHGVREKYYFARGPQLVNRVVDTSASIEKKIDCLCASQAQGPAGDAGAQWRQRLAAENLRLPLLGNDDRTANREYIRHFLLQTDAALGKQYGLAYAEQFHYIGPVESHIEEEIRRSAVPIR